VRQVNRDISGTDEPAGSETVRDDTAAGATPAPPSRRSSCPFGSACYRKNPQHRQDEAHPGDDDFKDPVATVPQDDNADDNADDDRPECEYGTDCYRQNPQHRKDYRHTAKPRPAKRKAAAKAAAAKKKKKNAGSDAEDYDSSFIDDDEDLSDERDLTSEEEEEWKPGDDDSN